MKKLIVSSLIVAQASLSLASNECKNIQNRVQIIAGGDVIFHGALHAQAMWEKKGFASLWSPVQSILDQADVVYANLEGPAAPKVNQQGKLLENSNENEYKPQEGVYSDNDPGKSYSFNFHPQSIEALIKSGFSVVSTANNHTYDRKVLGVDKTFEYLNSVGLQNFGTSQRGSIEDFYTIVNKNNISIGFIACTYGVNGDARLENKISYCYSGGKSNPILLNSIRQLAKKVDIVILTPHWGTEYQKSVNALQKALSRDAQAAGARIILGAHPHVVQEMEVNKNAQGQVESFTAFSMGNFVTNQMPSDYRDQVKHEKFFPQRFGQMLAISLQKVNGQVVINDPMTIPLYMTPKHQNAQNIRQVIPAYPELVKGNSSLFNAIKKTSDMAAAVLGSENLLNSNQLNSVFENHCN